MPTGIRLVTSAVQPSSFPHFSCKSDICMAADTIHVESAAYQETVANISRSQLLNLMKRDVAKISSFYAWTNF